MNVRALTSFFCTFLFGFAVQAQPRIISFSPVFGASNDLTFINIYGSGFYVGSANVTVKFNNVTSVPAAHVTTTDGTNIMAHVAPGTPFGPGLIFVQLVNGQSAFSSDNFTVIGPGPYISGFSPVAGGGNVSVTITGAHFTGVSGATGVTFNGKNALSYHVDTDAQITAQTPTGITTGPIKVTSSQGNWTTTSNFYGLPVITGFTPANGRSGTNLVVRGTNFTDAIDVKFSGTGGPFSLQVTPTVQNDTTLQVTVPAGVTNGPVRVDTPAGSPAITSSNFIIQPTVFGFTPGTGVIGATITITGANFNVGGLSVKFGGATASAPGNVSFGSLTATVPSGASNAPVTVTTANGSHTSSQVFHLPPVITSFTPTNTSPGATTVKITGQNFLDATAVTFTGVAPVAPNVTNNTTIGVTIPPGVITGPISVTGPAGTANSGNQLFYGAPVITSFNPTHGLPGTNVTVFGTNFLGATAVKFNGVTAAQPVNVVNNGQINTTVPNGASTGPVSVIGPGGTAVSAANFNFDMGDLALSLTDAPDPVYVGTPLVYTIGITNLSAVNLPNVMLTNTLPTGVGIMAATTTQGTLTTNGNPILGNLGTINAGAGVQVTLTVAPRTPGSIMDTASVGSTFPDPLAGNNSASVSTTVASVILSIAPLTDQVQLFWPAPLSNFTLQFRSDLGSLDWSNVSGQPTVVNGSNVVVESITNGSKFYRLKK